MDFQNDGEYLQGCIASGRRYFHINANGDMDPCVFIHYSDSNIREKTILEGLCSPMFMQYKNRSAVQRQPFKTVPNAGKPACDLVKWFMLPAHIPQTWNLRNR